MKCLLCRQDRDTRYIDLFVTGSEGLNVCHECEMKLVQYARQLIEKALDMAKDTRELPITDTKAFTQAFAKIYADVTNWVRASNKPTKLLIPAALVSEIDKYVSKQLAYEQLKEAITRRLSNICQTDNWFYGKDDEENTIIRFSIIPERLHDES